MQGDTTAVCHDMPNAPDALSFSADGVPGAFDFTSVIADAIDSAFAPVIEVLSQILTPEVLAQIMSGDFSQLVSSGLEVAEDAGPPGDTPIEVFLFGKSFFLAFDQHVA